MFAGSGMQKRIHRYKKTGGSGTKIGVSAFGVPILWTRKRIKGTLSASTAADEKV